MFTLVDHLRWKHAILLVGIVFFCLFSAEKAMASVVVNEVSYNPPGTDTNREWIELWNDSNDTIDITNWKLFEEGANHSFVAFQGSLVLGPDDFVVLTGSGSVFLTDHPGFMGKVARSVFSLSNTGEELQIRDQSGNTVHTISYTSNFANGNGMTLERNLAGQFVESLEVDGTPGDWNSVIPLPSPTPTPSPTPSPSPTPTPTPSPSIFPSIFINEILPDPNSGEQEWIELYNAGSTTIDLSMVQITDAGNTPKTLSGSILAGEYHVIEPVPVSLNNTGDTITLLTGTGAIIDQIIYTASVKGKSLGRFPDSATGSGSLITFGTPTKGSVNVVNNHPPSAIITIQSPFTTSGSAPFSLNITAENSHDIDGDDLQFFWDYGDGYTSTLENPDTYKYTRAGVYQLRLTVTDTFGLFETREEVITVGAATPSGGGGGGSASSGSSSSVLSCSSQGFLPQIRISAVLPNPQGSDDTGEFIELRNMEDRDVNICGWSIDDSIDGSTPYVISRDTIIPRNATLRILSSESKITLNNDKDHARLINPSGVVADDISYGESSEGAVYSLLDGVWRWTIDELSPVTSLEQVVTAIQSSIRINEVFPNPAGADRTQEWIELYNDGANEISLAGWKVVGKGGSYTFGMSNAKAVSDGPRLDARGKLLASSWNEDQLKVSSTPRSPARGSDFASKVESEGGNITIPAHGYLVISGKNLGFALRNSEEKLQLFDDQNRLVQIVIYQDAPEGKSFNFTSEKRGWVWSESTAEKENTITVPPDSPDFHVELFQGKQMLFLRGQTLPNADVELKIYGIDEDFTDDTVEPTLELRARSSQKVGSYSIGMRTPLENGDYRIIASVVDQGGNSISTTDYTLKIEEGATQYVKKAPVKRTSARKKSSSAKKAEAAKARRAQPPTTSAASTVATTLLPQFIEDVQAAGGPVGEDSPSSQLPYIYSALLLFILTGVGSIFYVKK